MSHTDVNTPTVMAATTRADTKEGVDEALVFLPVADMVGSWSIARGDGGSSREGCVSVSRFTVEERDREMEEVVVVVVG